MIRFIIEYSKLKGFWPPLGNDNNNHRVYFYMRIFFGKMIFLHGEIFEFP